MKKKDAYYFSHDANAASDEKILLLLTVYGYEGYGWYWRLIELMRESKTHRLSLSSKYAYEGFAKVLRSDPKRIKEFIHDCIHEFKDENSEGLFVTDKDCFWSPSLCRRMEQRDKINSALSEFGKLGAAVRWGKIKKQDDGLSHGKDTAESWRPSIGHMASSVRPSVGHMASETKPLQVIEKSVETDDGAAKDRPYAGMCKGKERKGKEKRKRLVASQRQRAVDGNDLMRKEFVLRLHDDEFKMFCSTIQQDINKENQRRNGNPFQWRPLSKSFESDLKSLIYSFDDKKKESLLYEVLNATKEKFNWAVLVRMAIQYTVKMSRTIAIQSPYRYVVTVLQTPSIITSEAQSAKELKRWPV